MSSRDARFKSLSSDPRFIKPKKVAQKVQVDERFANLLEDASSQDKNRVDKFGRRSKTNQKEKEDLKRFYKVEDGPEAGGSSSSKGKVKETLSAGERALKMARGELVEESSDESESELESNSNSGAVEEEEDDEDSALSGSEASGSEFSVNLSEDEDITNFPDAEDVDEEGEAEEITTTRLALVNMDWDHIRAVDLFKVLQSALTAVHPQGAVHRLSIYPSEFGKERMAREEKEGPPAELFATAEGREVKEQDIDEDDVDERMILKEQQDKGEEINSKALRRYQLERLRYFYAVAEFDSVKSARAAFLETQGTEFERSANVFELRAIPDDMSFEDEPKEIATSKDDLSAYQGGLDYVTTALRHSKVKLTWDQDDPQRSRLTRIDLSRIPKDKVDQIDYANYLASGSSDEESEQDDTTGGASRAAKFRAMLGLSAQPQRSSKSDRGAVKGDMEVTFRPVFEGDGDSASESGDEKQIDGDETTLDRYKRKERERRERKKQQRQAAMAADASGSQGEDQPDDFFEGFGDEDAAFAAALEAHDAGRDGPAGSGSQTSKKKSKAAKRAEKAKQAEENATQRAELELLVDEDGDKGHFDMDKIMRAEKAEGAGGASRSARRKRGAKAAKKEAEAKQALDQDSFVVDTRDDRFKSLAEDPAFAIDPSNPRYKKTKNMQKLLDDTRKQRDQRLASGGLDGTERKQAQTSGASNGAGGQERDIDSLVSAIKRKADGSSGKDKKSKKRKV